MPSFGTVLRRLQPQEQVAGDVELLHQFLEDRSAPAFEAIVRRHGPMVLRVCQRELPVLADAEDAFQATFLLLAQKARTIRQESSLAGWLIGVARRLARRLGQQLRQRRERLARLQPAPPRPVTADEHPSWWEDERRLLPQEYQAVIDLCLIQGLTREEAARQLGSSPQAVHGMLYRARIKLKKQLLERGTVAGSALVGTQATVTAVDRLAPIIAEAAVKLLEQGTLAGSVATPTVIGLLQPRWMSSWLVPGVIAGGLLVGGLGWWGMSKFDRRQPSSPVAMIVPTAAAATTLPSPQPLESLPQFPWQQQETTPQQPPQQQLQQAVFPDDDKVKQAGQSGVPLPPFQGKGQVREGNNAPWNPGMIPVPPADRVPTGSERLNLAQGMLSSAASLHEGMVALLPRQTKHTFDGKTLILSVILSDEELLDCKKKAPQVKIPPKVSTANDPSWEPRPFQIDWEKEALLVAVVMERANSVTLTTLDKCWIAPDAKGVGHLLLNYSGKEADVAWANAEDYRKSVPYVMLKVPRKDLKTVAVTVWRSGAKPDGVVEMPRGK